MITAVVIDDEKRSRTALKVLVEQHHSGIEVTGEADNVTKGIEMINQLCPDLLFLDVRLKNGTGFDILKRLEGKIPHLIFITAYSEYAIRAIKYSALDYLLKPVDPQELKSAIDRGLEQLDDNRSMHVKVLEENLDPTTGNSKKIMLSSANGFHVVKLEDIYYCRGESNYTCFHIKESSPITISKSLIEFEKMLPPTQFIRIHKSYIINVVELVQYKGGRNGTVVLRDGSAIPMSRDRKTDLVNRIKKNLDME